MAHYTSGTQRSYRGTVSERVVEGVAEARDVDPLDLPPLYDVVDPEALNRLFDHDWSSGRNRTGRVVFTVDGCEVVVHGDGDVDVTAPDERVPRTEHADAGSGAGATLKQDD